MTNVMTNIQFEPVRYLIRPGQDDHRELERLMTPGYWQKQPAAIDGVVLDAPFAHRLGEPLKVDPLRQAVTDSSTLLLVDLHSCRLAEGNWRPEAVDQLPYSARSLLGESKDGFTPRDFDNDALVRRFVRSALEFQSRLSASDYIAPSFYLDGQTSEWNVPNERILRESIRQAGTFVHASFCGSLSAIETSPFVVNICEHAASAYVLVSPMNARDSSVTKLLRFVKGLERFKDHGISVIAGRQPAFGLSLMALGISGFDSGLAHVESFDYRSTVRETKRTRTGGRRGGKSRPVYSSKLMTNLAPQQFDRLMGLPGMRGDLSCTGFCCRDNMTDAIQAAREHFVWSRLEEISQLREVSPAGRVRYVSEKLAGAHQLAKRVQRLVPEMDWSFQHLDNWSRVTEVVGAEVVRGT